MSLALVAGLAAPALARPEPIDWDWKERHRRGPTEGRGNGTWGGLARNRDELRRLWELYDQPGAMPIIRFEKNVAVVAGTAGSSSCPARLHDVRLNRERKRIVVRMYVADGDNEICTADFVPRTFAVAVARADLEPLGARALRLRPREIEDPNG
ncbi:MAG: hypothetical protein M3134_02815 [Actinomycetota bacterium]|nr:hypothetical protein [Actinomycetota bacterium]